MDLTQEQYQKIADYFSGALSEEAEKQFLLEVAANPALQEEFEFARLAQGKLNIWKEIPEMMKDTALSEDYAQNKQRLAAIRDSLQQQEQATVITPWWRKPWLVAAAAIIVITAGILLWYLLSQKSTPEIVEDPNKPVDTPKQQIPQLPVPDKGLLAYERYYKAYTPADLTPIELQQVVSLYKKGSYPGALHELQAIGEIRGNNPGEEKFLQTYTAFYRGLCHLSLQQPDSAVLYLGKAYTHKKEAQDIQEDITWYLALSYLRLKQTDKAIPLFTILSKQAPGKKYRRQSADIVQLYK